MDTHGYVLLLNVAYCAGAESHPSCLGQKKSHPLDDENKHGANIFCPGRGETHPDQSEV